MHCLLRRTSRRISTTITQQALLNVPSRNVFCGLSNSFPILEALDGHTNPHISSHLPPRPSPSTPRSRFVFSRLFLSTCYFLGTAGIKRLDAAYLYAITAAGKLLTDAPLHLRVLGVLCLRAVRYQRISFRTRNRLRPVTS